MLSFLSFWLFVSVVASSVVAKGVVKNPKRGLAFAAGDTPGDLINANQSDSVITWQYNWASLPPIYLASSVSSLKYIPMQWGSAGVQSFADDVATQGADTILTFNEPDFVNESNMQPEDAAQLWMQYIQPLKAKGIRLGGPAVTASGTGLPWLTSFFAACTNCTVDFLPLHWYGSGFEGFAGYLGTIRAAYPNMTLWITEYAETSTNDTVVAEFLNQTITYLDGLDYVERYSWFGYFRPMAGLHYNLLDADGGLNTLGQMYTGAKTIHTQVVTSTASQYVTVNGADNPTQGLITTFAALSGSTNLLGPNSASLMVSFGISFLTCLFGAVWTLL